MNGSDMCAAPVGNQFWKARSSHGRKPLFSKPDDLWKACIEYFEWVEDNPLLEEKAFAYQGEVTTHNLTKMRAMTLGGLWIFLDICKETWYSYKDKDDFVSVTTRVEEIIRNQKFTGAAADLLNPNIIARDLGLADKKKHEINAPFHAITSNMSPKEAAEAYADTLKADKADEQS